MLEEFLKRERDRTIRKWFDLILKTYPEETVRFLKAEKDPFANPVGAAIRQGIEGMFDVLFQEKPLSEDLVPFLDRIIRIRAVQDFSPSESVAFIFSLKASVREVLKKEIEQKNLAQELASLESRVDQLALLAFDVYMKCREEIYELRVQELRRSRDSAIRMMGGGRRPSREAPQGQKP